MSKLVFNAAFLSILLSSTCIAASEDCLSLVGKYIATPENDPGYEPASLQISADSTTQTFELTYGVASEMRFRTESYSLDGLTHSGDSRWTGDKYTANCNAGVITLINEYPGLIITRTISTLDSTLTEYLYFQDKYSRLQGSYQKNH